MNQYGLISLMKWQGWKDRINLSDVHCFLIDVRCFELMSVVNMDVDSYLTGADALVGDCFRKAELMGRLARVSPEGGAIDGC